MNILLSFIFLSALLDWYAVYKGWKKLEYFLKPVTMIFLFIFLFVSTGFQDIALWFGIGIIFSLAGDIFLMLPKEQFIAGLVAFLIAHIAYIIGFNQTLPAFNIATLIWAVLLGIIAAQLYKQIAAGLVKQSKESLLRPVLTYTAVIAIMLLSALITLSRPEWSSSAAITVSIGAALFMLSDAILAWNKFVEPIKNGRVMNMAAYHLGQIILIYGVVMHF
ncbi:MAG: lysoplasmalogenase [Anaerolineae bacterium]|jgi:uncharacterized membrane protein YhhN|nr:lysoplasmalogenase [Anaerolineae bacterium]MBT7075352.1 lysoplasmalogenase [Anaerolineae bacterium]